MKAAKVQIAKLDNGWTLEPRNEEGKKIIVMLYRCESWEKFLEEKHDNAVFPDKPVEDFVERVIDVAQGANISVSKCGSPALPTFQFWDNNVETIDPVRLDTELKWSVWSACLDYWIERESEETVDVMRKAFEGTGPVCEVFAGCYKEIRSGNVTISKGKAEGYFVASWDEVYDLAQTLNMIDEDGNWKTPGWERPIPINSNIYVQKGITQEQVNSDQEMCFIESLPGSMYACDGVGVEVDFSVRARKFERLMEKIDAEEDRLLTEDREMWDAIESIYRIEDEEEMKEIA